jgi:hypothetical protein
MKKRVTGCKDCYCHTCKRDFHYLGISRHRAMHRDKKEDCVISYTNGDRYRHEFSKSRR